MYPCLIILIQPQCRPSWRRIVWTKFTVWSMSEHYLLFIQISPGLPMMSGECFYTTNICLFVNGIARKYLHNVTIQITITLPQRVPPNDWFLLHTITSCTMHVLVAVIQERTINLTSRDIRMPTVLLHITIFLRLIAGLLVSWSTILFPCMRHLAVESQSLKNHVQYF